MPPTQAFPPVVPVDDMRPAPSRRRVTVFRVLALLPVILFSVNALNLLAPWTFVIESSDDFADAHRWFITTSAAADLLGLAAFVGLIVRPRLPALAAWIPLGSAIVAVFIVPLQPEFLILVAILIGPAAIAYPYWSDLRHWRGWWAGVRAPLLTFAWAVAAAMLVLAIAAFRRQVVRDDLVTDANWWNDYAEHIADIGLFGVLAVCRAPGALILRGVLSGIWVYLGIIGAFVLPDAIGSWGVVGGLVGIAIGLVFAGSTWLELRARTAAKYEVITG